MKTLIKTFAGKTIGDTLYSFASKGKKPELCETSKYPRKNAEVKIRDLRPWQKNAFEKLKNSNFFLVKAFCGSGKTTLSIVLALWDIIFNKRKQLSIVPQSHIGDGFSICGKFNIPGLGKVTLTKPQNFCDDSDNKTDMLVEFMLGNFEDSRSIKKVSTKTGHKEFIVFGYDCMAVATHQCFVAAIQKITQRENDGEKGLLDKALKNISLSIDEAHHICTGSSDEEIDTKSTYNRLGNILKIILERSSSNNTRVGLTTATFFRGDQGIIVSEDDLNTKFKRYELDFLSHFETLGIKDVFVNFEEYTKDPIKQIVANIEKELFSERHLVVVPTGSEIDGQGAKWRKLDTHLIRLKTELSKMLERNGLSINDVVLDLVNKETQKYNKNILLKEPKESYDPNETKNSKIRIVITCMLGREGTDWCPCSRLHNASIELGSTTLAVQTLGRLFRKFQGKTKVGVTYYIKKFESLESSHKKREYFSNRVNAILALMLIDDWMNPILLPELPATKYLGTKRNKNSKKKYVRLSDVYSREDFEKMQNEIMWAQSTMTEFKEESSEGVIQKIIAKYAKKKPVGDSDIIAGFKVFLLRARSQTLRSKGIDITYIREQGFDEIIEKHKLEGNFWIGEFTKEKFIKFKELIDKISWTGDQKEEIRNNIISIMKKLGKEIIVGAVDKNDAKIIKKLAMDFCEFHEAYNAASKKEGKITPSQKEVAKRLKISSEKLREKINLLNQITPKGYRFFNKISKITEKLPTAA